MREPTVVRYGFFLPNFGPFGDPRLLGDLAARAEGQGWDGFFVWDHILFTVEQSYPVTDPWIALAVAATATTSVRLGALMTPLSRRRPWKVARETVALDHLSGGRLIFGAGLGHPPVADFTRFGEQDDDRIRAARLDQALDVLTLLWSGQEVTYAGDQFRVGPVTFLPRPVQRPRIPVWVAGWWPHRPPFRRAARWDGVVPELDGGAVPSPGQVRELVSYVREHAEPGKELDVVVNGVDCWGHARVMRDYVSAGLTWWLERVTPSRAFSAGEAEELIDRGPPR